MLLDNNTERVMNLIEMFDDLKEIDKIRLAIHLLEDLGFVPTYDINNFIRVTIGTYEEMIIFINALKEIIN